MANEEPDKVVCITLNSQGLPVPDQDPVQVKKEKQRIRWCADFNFQIEMVDYTDLKYSRGGSGCAYQCTSGKFPTVRKYKYSITAGGKTNDPEVDVFP